MFSYLSYHDKEQEIEVIAGETLVINGEMEMASIMGEEVVITGMMRGQTAAINQQVTSNTIVNVVSKEKISELPDANAAEAIARLPGISLQRDAGEGTKVVIRGMAPKFNSITINGERIPSTDPIDRLACGNSFRGNEQTDPKEAGSLHIPYSDQNPGRNIARGNRSMAFRFASIHRSSRVK
jgi:outer membrane receptor for ferrienterochelin and colicin